MLRLKIIVIIIAGILFLTGTLFGVSKILLLKSYGEIETVLTDRNIVRTENAITSISSGLNVKLRDWAIWDDSYQFVQDKNEAFIESNLANQSLSNLEINFIVYINLNGEIVFSKYVDIESRETLQTDLLMSELTNYFSGLLCTEISCESGGLIGYKHKLLFIEGLPILQSTGEGPVMGTIFFGKFVDNRVIQNIHELTQLDITIDPNLSESLPPQTIAAREMLASSPEPHYIAPLSEDTIAGYFFLSDVKNNPVAIVTLLSPREIFVQGTKTQILFTMMSGVAIFIFGVIMLLLIERVLLRRFGKLAKEVSGISVQNLSGTQISVSSNDEIGQLGVMINHMLDELSKLQMQERELRALEQAASTKLKDGFEETAKMNNLMVDREIKMIELKKTIAELEAKLEKKSP